MSDLTSTSKNRLEYAMKIIDEVYACERARGNKPDSLIFAKIHNGIWKLINDDSRKEI